jgi:hypothetical protein
VDERSVKLSKIASFRAIALSPVQFMAEHYAEKKKKVPNKEMHHIAHM